MLDPARMDHVLRRGNPQYAEAVTAWQSVDERRKRLQGELDTIRQQRNGASERISKLDKKSAEFTTAVTEMKALGTRIKEGEAELARLEAEAHDLHQTIPNAPHESVPDGHGEEDNPVLHTWGTKPTFAFKPQAHWDLGPALGILDFDAG